VHNNTIGGFTPNSNSPDPNWGKCLQCAAVDRARLRENITSRSSVCQQCFSQYCYDPLHPPSSSELPNRKFTLVDPDPRAISAFLSHHKGPLIGGLLGLAATIGALIGFLYVLFPSPIINVTLLIQNLAQEAQASPVREG
jgi:lysophospholipase